MTIDQADARPPAGTGAFLFPLDSCTYTHKEKEQERNLEREERRTWCSALLESLLFSLGFYIRQGARRMVKNLECVR